MTKPSYSIQNLLLYITTILIWGSSWLAIKFQLGYVDPMVSVAYRFILASGISWLYCSLSGKLMRFDLRDHFLMFLQGTCLFSLNYLLFYISELTLTSGLAAVIFSTLVVMNMLNGIIFLKNRFELRMGFGACLGLAGIVMVFWPEITNFEMGDENLTATAMAYGALLMLVLSFASGKEFTIELTASYIGSLLFLSVFATIFAFLSYLTLVGRVGVERGAYATLVFPLVALGISTVFESYQWSAYAGAGVALILAGNLLILRRSSS